MAKKPFHIPVKQLEGYVYNGSPTSEIADYFGVKESKLLWHYRKEIKKMQALRRIRLRKMQWESAENGKVSMQIVLGKHELEQGTPQVKEEPRVIRRRKVNRGS